MSADVPEVPVDMTVRTFVDERLLRSDYSCYPVTNNGAVIGVVGAEEVRKVSSEKWEYSSVGEIAHAIDGAYKINATDDAW
jgi:CBS domain-containing protein